MLGSAGAACPVAFCSTDNALPRLLNFLFRGLGRACIIDSATEKMTTVFCMASLCSTNIVAAVFKAWALSVQFVEYLPVGMACWIFRPSFDFKRIPPPPLRVASSAEPSV